MDTLGSILHNPLLALSLAFAIALGFFALQQWLFPTPEKSVPSFTVPLPAACKSDWKGEELLNPTVKVSGSSLIQCYCPASGQLLGRINPVTRDGIDRAIAAASKAQKQWAKTSLTERKRVLKTVLRYILHNQEAIVTAACRDTGKSRVDAIFGEIMVTTEKLQWTITNGEKAIKPSRRPTNFLMMYKKNTVAYEPLGVVTALVSWNYPFHNALSPAIATLFTGNALVLKPSEQVAWSTAYFVSILRAALTATGHSADLIQNIPCWPNTASHITSHPDISHITFIGSRRVGHLVAASAAQSLTPTVIELGGKDPAIVLDTVADSGSELSRVADILMRGTFQASGQNCLGIERIIATPRAYNALLSVLPTAVRSLRQGDPLSDEPVDVGAMVSDAPFAELEALIKDAVTHGAKLLAGGQAGKVSSAPNGHFFAPTLLVDVTREMRIAQVELFAPVMVVMLARGVDDVIAIANSTQYALGASVFGSAGSKDVRRVVKEVRAGNVSVNDFGVFYAVGMPFGGVGGSGYGRFGGEEGLRGLCNVKSICEDRFWGVKTPIPGPLRLPYDDVNEAWRVVRGVIEVGYATGWMWWRGLGRVVGIIKS
ncbi:ALDH-like protein [Eremomyces bilateralis CBS 781.70]|uniref:aldehyde dehydrogenase (NAD(+)) n=1 Tax=Eremomyces bilateralis CBS 781.70 TaxID=1392243 RepID=A0A6G1FU06_9PEZI|nr:ALDH-like protein [Eremomyces bilateralis CBS 781.70]KAF1809151.1 ALDH-like protein [Eremomyces bilateralis CBS 781.70]